MTAKLIVILKYWLISLLGRQVVNKITKPFYFFTSFVLTRVRIRKLLGKSVCVQIGCGSRPLKTWTNIDIVHGYADIVWDVRRSLPFKTGTVEAIFCEHVIEHLTKQEGRLLLSECYRVLKTNGVARFSTPDAEKYLVSYVNKDNFISSLPIFQEQNIPRIDVINHVMRENGSHLWLYDKESLSRAFVQSGFTIVHKQPYGLSTLDIMNNLDCADRRVESLYVEAIK